MALSRDRDLPRVRGRHRAPESNYGIRLMCLTLPGRTSALMPQGNVRPSESACGRPTPPPLGCVRSRERRAWPASAHVWDRTVRSGTRLLCPCITIGVAVVRVCATGFQPPWGPWPLRHVRRRTGCLRSVANVLEPVVWTTPQPSLGRNVVRMSQVLPSQGSANGWPSGYRHLDATHILGPVVLRCARVSPAALACLMRGVAGGASQERTELN